MVSRIIVWASIISLSFSWYVIGYQKAHYEVATECERLGGFYVNDKTFVCALKSPAPQEQRDE